MRALHAGWEIPEATLATIPAQVQAIFDDAKASTRDRLRAGELLKALHDHNTAKAQYLDKNARLDEGKATESVGVVFQIVRGE